MAAKTKKSNKMEVNAQPTKEFFISMLVKDIQLIPAIIDLVDNSVDGARRVRPGGDFTGLSVRLELDKDLFEIDDNCGGIAVQTARDYAFRFGRPGTMPSTKHSIGQFGVGMKRTLFKLGSHFRVDSRTATSHFEIDVDVERWKTAEDDWHFKFAKLKEGITVPEDQRGTRVVVDQLHETVAADFALENFLTRLRNEIRDRHQESMAHGLAVSVNGVPVDVQIASLLNSDRLSPARFEKKYPGHVRVRIYTGLAESKPAAAGWYVYCNGRLVLRADQTIVTGWGEGEEKSIPRFHNQFARFRGFAFLDCNDPRRLPWNTTKTGVDSESPLFRAVRSEIIALARPVINFLNALKEEKEAEPEHKPLEEAIQAASPVAVADLQGRGSFEGPRARRQAPEEPRTGRVGYSKPVEEIERVKKALKVRTNREVGERTFEYYYGLECGT